MPKQGGQGKGKPKLGDRDLGKALLKKQSQGFQGLNGDKVSKMVDMRSILDNSALDDFIITADMENENSEVHRVHQNDTFLVNSESKRNPQSLSLSEFSFQHLVIPRKPAWNVDMTAEEVDYNEKKNFLQWRRNIAALECSNTGGLKVTPFEKNLDVWRQLWRAVERSDLLVQIVDARNPLLYFTSDLMKYVSEQSPAKPMMLIVNKGDFLTDFQRSAWAQHFHNMNVKFVFYSAKLEQVKLDEGTAADLPDEAHSAGTGENPLAAKILTRSELLRFFDETTKQLGLVPQKKNKDKVCIGMVGYPNVGKSSVINTLLGVSKSSHGVVRVGVSSTPGKTKHFQTLELSSSLMLCDCPGLVFPSFMNSTGEMICAGILPINQMRDYVEPAEVIASRVPQHIMEAVYGMQVIRELDLNDDSDRPATSHEILCAYCAVKGYITNGTGRWDEFRACKELLRDFADGKILYVAPPSSVESETDRLHWLSETETVMLRRSVVSGRLLAKKATSTDDHTASSIEMGLLPGEEKGGMSAKRDHKRLKHWGKKNKKLRDKDPYGDHHGPESYVIYSTNREKDIR